MNNKKEAYDQLLKMSIDERVTYLKEHNVTKESISTYLDSNPALFLVKNMVKKQISNLSEEDFLRLIASKIELVPSSMLG